MKNNSSSQVIDSEKVIQPYTYTYTLPTLIDSIQEDKLSPLQKLALIISVAYKARKGAKTEMGNITLPQTVFVALIGANEGITIRELQIIMGARHWNRVKQGVDRLIGIALVGKINKRCYLTDIGLKVFEAMKSVFE